MSGISPITQSSSLIPLELGPCAKLGKWLIETLKPIPSDDPLCTAVQKICVIVIGILASLILALPTLGLSIIAPLYCLYKGSQAISSSPPNIKSENDIWTEIFTAIESGNLATTLEILKEHPKFFEQAGSHAVYANQDLIACALIANIDYFIDKEKATELFHQACSRGLVETVKALIEHNLIDLKATSKEAGGSWTCLHHAVWGQQRGSNKQIENSKKSRLEIVKILLHQAPELAKITTAQGRTVLSMAEFRGDIEMQAVLQQALSASDLT